MRNQKVSQNLKKETTRQTNSPLQRASVHPVPEQADHPVSTSANSSFSHNFSRVPVRTGNESAHSASTESRISHEPSEGQRLDPATHGFLRSRFGQRFDTVRVSSGGERLSHTAIASAEGNRLRFAPALKQAPVPIQRVVTAHEAAHVIQWQRGQELSANPWSEQRLEHEAQRIGLAAAHNRTVAIHGVARDTRPRFHPIFISTVGSQSFLNYAARFHERWGYGTPQRVGSIEEIVTELGRGTGSIGRVTIVSHAVPDNINISFLRGGPGFVRQSDWESTTPETLTGYSGHSIGLNAAERTMRQVRRRHRNADWWQRLRPSMSNPLMRQFVWWLVDVDHLRKVRPRNAIPQRQRVVNRAREYAGEYKELLQEEIRAFAGYGLDVREVDLDALEDAINEELRSASYDPITRPIGRAIARQVRSGRDVAVRRVLEQGVAQEGGFFQSLFWTRVRLGPGSIIEVKGCRIGQNHAYLEAISRFFAYPGLDGPIVTAPDMFQWFGHLGARQHPDNTRRLSALWRNRRIRQAFLYWAGIFNWPLSTPPDAADLVAFLRAGHAFPVGLTLHFLRGSAPGSLTGWFARFGYLLARAPDIEQEFLEGRSLSAAMQYTIIDWLQDRRRRPTQLIFPSDPEYQNHFQSAQATSMGQIFP